jgi:hypothetical protein
VARLLTPLFVVAITYGGINTLSLWLSGPGSHFLDPFLILVTSGPVGIVAALFWFRGIRAKRTTIRHGGFVGFYAFLVTLLNPAAWLVYASSFTMGFWLNVFLLPLLGFWCGLAIGAVLPNIRLERTR